MKRFIAPFIAFVVVACAGGHASDPPAPSSPVPVTSLPDASTERPSAVDAGTTETPAKPAPVERTGKTWPFHAWDRAEAFTFNRFPMREDAQLRIYDDNGWSKYVVDKKPLDAALAKQAFDLVQAGKSELAMTKCPFPRHAVVFYENEIPVASVNVCFECGDILLWPRWGAPEMDWDKLTDAQRKKALAELEANSAKKEKAFAQVFPKWKTLFRDSIGFPIDDTRH